MQKKVLTYSLSILLVLFVAYNSVYFKKLDAVKSASASKAFDAGSYASNFYKNKLIPQLGSAIEISKLMSLLQTQPDKAFHDYSRALAIGNIRYFLVQAEGTITSIEEDAITIALKNDSANTKAKIATEFVYGNAIRDASGLINLNDFSSTSDFNKVSEEINKIIRKEVLPPFKTKAKPGDVVKLSGAIELNQAHLSLDFIEIVPIQLTILQ